MKIDLKQIICDALMHLKETIKDLDALMPTAPSAEVAAALKCSQLGALVAGTRAIFMQAPPPARALILDAAQKCFYLDADIQALLDQMKSVGVKQKINASDDVMSENIDKGSRIAIAAIKQLNSEDLHTVSQQIGALLGLIEGVVHLGGFDSSLYEAKERARDAIVNYGHSAFMTAVMSDFDKSGVN